MSQYNLKTGDLLLFDYKAGGWFGVFTKLIKYFTKSKYSHIAMVLKDPTYINPKLKGYYIWESSWEDQPDPQDNKRKLGVEITPFDEIYDLYKEKDSNIYVRRVDCNSNLFSSENLKEIHKVVYDKPYDMYPKDWYEAIKQNDSNPQKTDRFWCSALVGYIYTKCGLLDSSTDWSMLRPIDFALDGNNDLKFINNAKLEDKQQQIL